MSTEKIMEQAQVFASAWSVVGGPFDDGDAMEVATQEKDELNRMVSRLAAERDALAAKLAELEGQEPVAWVEVVSTHEGPYNFEGMALLGKGNHLLYARPVPAEEGIVTVTTNDAGRCVMVSRQDEDRRILSVIWEAKDVPTEPVNARLLDALKRAKDSLVAFKFVPGGANCWEASDEENLTAVNSAIAAAEAAHTEPVNVDFGKRGENMFFKIGNQSFLLDYKPEEQVDFDFMKAMLLSAFSRITHGVKTETQPVNVRLLEALSALLDDIEALIGESAGVYGLHLNGDVSPWSELEEGGRFERLSSMSRAREAIAAAEAQQERLLQDMHDAGREIDRVMDEPAPKVPQIDLDAIARAIWNVRRQEEDRCDMELEDMRRDHSVWEEATEVASILKDAGIEVAE